MVCDFMTIIKNEDLPERMKKRQAMAQDIAEDAFSKVWNHATDYLEKNDKQIVGNEALTYFGTILSNFAARWIIYMDKIAKSDSAGIETEEIVKVTLNGILTMIGCKAEFEDDRKDMPDGIKRLKK